MYILPETARDIDVIATVRSWIDLLADDRYVASYEAANSDGTIPSRVTRCHEARTVTTSQPSQDVQWFSRGETRKKRYAGSVHFDIPINGE